MDTKLLSSMLTTASLVSIAAGAAATVGPRVASSATSTPTPTTTTTTSTTPASTTEAPLTTVSDMKEMSSKGDVIFPEDSPEFTFETFYTIFVTLMIVLTNCAIIMVAAWTEAFSNFNKTFIFSLALADLLIGLFVTPYSIFLSVYRRWVFESEMFCSVQAYVFTTLITAKMYSLTWLLVDHYVAVRKPERYNVMMSPARSLCWISFSWVVAISFCCPPLFSFESAVFNENTCICMIDSQQQMAYILTSGVLSSGPSLVAMTITSAYLFTNSFKTRIQFYEKVFVELSARPKNYHMTFLMCAVFQLSWIPFSIVFLLKQSTSISISGYAQFYTCWLGIGTSFSQFLILLLMSQDFRQSLWEISRIPGWCSPVCCEAETVDVNIITLPKKR